MTDRPLEVSSAALASYLRDLGFEHAIKPEGWDSEGAGVSGTDAKRDRDERPATRQSDPNSGRAKTSPDRSASGATRVPRTTASARSRPFVFDSDQALDRSGRLRVLDQVRQVASSCTACVLADKRQNVVFGDGDGNADLLIVGEGPGAQEDRLGLPFVGPAGELLTKMLEAIQLRRSSVYIANVVKCRPPGNRDPSPEEISCCSGFFDAQVSLIAPRLILVLGRVAAQALLSTTQPLGQLRNQWHDYRGVPSRVTYHPAALLRNAGYKRPAWEDLQLVRDRLNELAGVTQGS